MFHGCAPYLAVRQRARMDLVAFAVTKISRCLAVARAYPHASCSFIFFKPSTMAPVGHSASEQSWVVGLCLPFQSAGDSAKAGLQWGRLRMLARSSRFRCAADTITTENVGQRHEAFEFVNVGSAHDWQDVQSGCTHAFQGDGQTMIGVQVWKACRSDELAQPTHSVLKSTAAQRFHRDHSHEALAIHNRPSVIF